MNVDGYWLPRHDQDKLIELLDQIPDLIEDLTIDEPEGPENGF